MPARPVVAPPTLSVRSLRLPPWARIGLAVWVGLAPTAPAWAHPLGTEGRWGAWKDLGAQAVNMILLPGSGSYHSYVLFWKGTYIEGYDNLLAGGLLRWNAPAAGKDYCATGDTDDMSYAYVEQPGFDIFCAGNSALADGRVLVSSGHIAEDIGPVETTVFDPATQSFQATPDSMSGGRWYPTNLTLPNGEALVFGGTQYFNVMSYGGTWHADTLNRDPRLQRIYFGASAAWQTRALIAPDFYNGQPSTRQGHTFIPNGTNPPILFGGRDSVGIVHNDFWFQRGIGSDIGESYLWEKRFPTGTAPEPRSGHIAVLDKDSRMFVFGGVQQDGAVLNDTRTWTPGSSGYGTWSNPGATGSPPARQGHAAIADLVGGRNRMLMFGGVNASGTPVDDAVWQYNFASGAWDSIAITGTRPVGRQGHTMVYVPDPVDHDASAGGVDNKNRVLVYAGKNSSAFLNDLWELWIDEGDGTVSWNQISSGAHTARAFHSAVYDRLWKRMIVIGGETSTGVGSDSAFALAGIAKLATGPWGAVPHNPDHALYGHKTLEGPLIQNREIEKFTPWNSAGQRWAKVDSAYRRMDLYPYMFVLPSGNVFHAGGSSNTTTAILDMSLQYPDWKSTTFPSQHDGGAAVMYRPGEVLKTGGQHSAIPNAKSERIRFNASDTPLDNPAWQLTVADSMHHQRMEHNLTVLPNGQVIVTGGRNDNSGDDAAYMKRPELYDPTSAAWTTKDTLAPSLAQRGYHSSAILMPDGRIATGGGNYTYGSDSLLVYCPPYLFKPGTNDGATRPRFSTNGAPLSMVRWGKTFTACVEETTGIRGAALLRPGATTHGQDQNQRYVPLTIRGHEGNPKRLFLTAPADSNIAPPGYYMLFLTGSPDRGDVPSIARWVRVGRAHGRDTCDVLRPGKVTELQPDVVGSSSIVMLWYSQGDDSTLAPSGAATRYQMRRSSAAISDENAWTYATPVTTLDPLPAPEEAGTLQSTEVTGVSACTYYHFALRAEDDNHSTSAPGNPLSGLHDDVMVQTLCGGGGGFSAQRVVGTAGANGTVGSGMSSSRAPAQAYSLEPGPGIMIVEPCRSGSDGWRVTVRFARDADRLDPGDGGELLVQIRTESGQWVTRARMSPGEGDQKLGIGSLRENGRVVVPANYALDQIVPTLRLGSRSYALGQADHSRLGELDATFTSDGGRVQMAAGDSLQLAYEPVETVAEGAASWYLLAGRTGPATPASNRRTLPTALPSAFALHPNQPNPFRGVTVIPFDLPVPRTVRLEVFDLLGRRVATLTDGPYPAGSHTVEWDLQDVSGGRARPGVYVYRMSAGDFRAKGKMSVLP